MTSDDGEELEQLPSEFQKPTTFQEQPKGFKKRAERIALQDEILRSEDRDPVLGPTKAAEFLGISPQALRNYHKNGELYPDSVSGKKQANRQYKVSSLKRFIEKRTRTHRHKETQYKMKALPLVKRRGNMANWAKENVRFFSPPMWAELTPDQREYATHLKHNKQTRIKLDSMSEFGWACTMCGMTPRDAVNRFGSRVDKIRQFWYLCYQTEAPRTLWLDLAAMWKRINVGRVNDSDPASSGTICGTLDRLEMYGLEVDYGE